MVKGGYQIVDLKGYKFIIGGSMQYKDLYSKIEGTDKVILLSGLNVEGVEYHDVFCKPIVDGSTYVFDVYGYNIVVSDNDNVTVNNDYIDLSGEGFDFEVSGDYAISTYNYNKLTDALNGKFRNIKGNLEGDYFYGTILSSKPISNDITVAIGNQLIKIIRISKNNTINIL